MELKSQVIPIRVSHQAYLDGKHLVIETNYGSSESTQLHLDFGELLRELASFYYSSSDGTYDAEWVTLLRELKRVVDESLQEALSR